MPVVTFRDDPEGRVHDPHTAARVSTIVGEPIERSGPDNDLCLGVVADVEVAGTMRAGDPVTDGAIARMTRRRTAGILSRLPAVPRGALPCRPCR